MKHLILLLIAMIWNGASFARTTQHQIYECYITGDMATWKIVMDDFAKRQLSAAEKLNLINFYYGYIGYQLGEKNKAQAQIYIDKGDAIIDELIKTSPTADVYAYKGAYIGFKIAISPYKAPFIGNTSIKYVDKALEIGPQNIQAIIEKANVCYFTPEIFGGSKAEALKYNETAINLFERDSGLTTENWVYLALLTRTAWFHTQNKNYVEAKRIYQKILNIEPDYSYVKEELYPDLVKLMN